MLPCSALLGCAWLPCCRRQVPQVVEDFWWVYLVVNLMLLALYALQVMWMWAIIRWATCRALLFRGPEVGFGPGQQVHDGHSCAAACLLCKRSKVLTACATWS